MAELGLCGPTDASLPASEYAAVGARRVRYAIEYGRDTTGFIRDCHSRGIKVLLGCYSELLTDAEPEWPERFDWAHKLYGGLADAFEIGNEPHGNPPASWVMDDAKLQRLLYMAYARLPNARLIGPGDDSGNAGWLWQRDVMFLAGVSEHPYGQAPGDPADWRELPGDFGYIGDNVGQYAAAGLPVWISEVGVSTNGSGLAHPRRRLALKLDPQTTTLDFQARYCGAMMAALRDDPRVEAAFWFSLHDFDGFGLLRSDGSRKPAWYAFQQAAGGPLPTPSPQPTPADGWTPIPGSDWWRYGVHSVGAKLKDKLVAHGYRPVSSEANVNSEKSAVEAEDPDGLPKTVEWRKHAKYAVVIDEKR